MEIIAGLIVASIVGLVGWIYSQSIKITRLETKSEIAEHTINELTEESSTLKNSIYNIDAKIDKKVNETTKEFIELLNKVNITLEKLNTTMGFVQEEIKELKKK